MLSSPPAHELPIIVALITSMACSSWPPELQHIQEVNAQCARQMPQSGRRLVTLDLAIQNGCSLPAVAVCLEQSLPDLTDALLGEPPLQVLLRRGIIVPNARVLEGRHCAIPYLLRGLAVWRGPDRGHLAVLVVQPIHELLEIDHPVRICVNNVEDGRRTRPLHPTLLQ
eukprot:CAMPEP_0177470532 /NCGR_PEP_ID=MMETSP0369-20130122/20254_1 /TAXON_ID=447022 ORGANISM="Scrippsiella hangoei-like, Strain SHHI-4" /NCGR_SAMPLE_ID=MMETSP0369 /ASSEMBLY_ACC=CAM_ASM_000364 /LENGTH=168 /DNA_ID=CAMNT_0018945003 /DNA_START=120 /DNA_END=627 /DNA_ORIENTATION=-